jgi:hypothetical protein
MEGSHFKGANAIPTPLLAVNQAGLLEHREVFGHGIERHVEAAGHVAHSGRTVAESPQNGAAGPVGDRTENAVQMFLMVNHTVESMVLMEAMSTGTVRLAWASGLLLVVRRAG